ncbi:short coiled-coil protein isoform X3 [Trachypithecus francoisi]|uniref:short coiled-coil protein isoform X3 n=1 Tax=Trachypithecus francoisi TaxID=54180 RepID=UPI00141B8D5B|nr:short coiled-coil protein isoform X3 [Trachypithecus francoisi]
MSVSFCDGKAGSRCFEIGRLGGGGQLMRRRVSSSRDWRAGCRDGAGFFSRTFCGRSGRSCRRQLVQVSRPEVSSWSLPLPAPQAEGPGVLWEKGLSRSLTQTLCRRRKRHLGLLVNRLLPRVLLNKFWEVRFGKEKEDTFLKDRSSKILYPRQKSLLPKMMNADMDAVDAENQVELEEKTRLINQVLELQHTLEDLSARVDAVKEENLKLKSENQVLGQYIENLMSASSVFQTTDTKSKRK